MCAMIETECQVALKEWAVAVRTLDAGRHILLIRKGGIREEGKAFRVRERSFLLYPAYEHQKQELLKAAYHGELRATMAAAADSTSVTFTHWAQVHQVVEVTEASLLATIDDHHIWSASYAQKRLHWKPRQPLAVMLVRAYRLAEPRTVPALARYSGCTSWVDLKEPVLLGEREPVMADGPFLNEVEAVTRALGAPAAALASA